MDCHIHWISDSRQSIIYKRMCKLQKCRIYPKSQVKNIGEGCGNLVKQEICPNYVLLRVNDLFKASYISKQRFNALYAAFESCVHGALKVAFPTVLGIGARGTYTQPHRRCSPLTGSDGNATMLTPTMREYLLFPSSSPSARWPGRFQQVQSMVAYAANNSPSTRKPLCKHLRLYKDEGVKAEYPASDLRLYKRRGFWHK